MQCSKIKVTLGETGTVTHEHGTGCMLSGAIVTPDPADPADGGPTFAEVFWNGGKYITVKGTPGSMQIVTCIPNWSGPVPDNSAAPTPA